MSSGTRPAISSILFFSAMLLLGLYFLFAAIQGDFGVFQRADILAETRQKQAELDAITIELARMENLTRRLSDDFLDLDLLDERARDMLGVVRPDEIVIR